MLAEKLEICRICSKKIKMEKLAEHIKACKELTQLNIHLEEVKTKILQK